MHLSVAIKNLSVSKLNKKANILPLISRRYIRLVDYMRPLQPPAAPSMSDQELECERRKLITEVYALGIALNDYVPAGKLCSTYDAMNKTPLTTRVRELGYQSVEDMLMTCGCFVCAIIQSKKHFKAEATAGNKATQDLSSLVRRQTKKKQKGPKVSTNSRQYFNRNSSRSKSFHGRTAFGAGFTRPNTSMRPSPMPPVRAPEYLVKRDETGAFRSVHGPPKGFTLPNTSRCTSSATSRQDESGMKSCKETASRPVFNGNSSSFDREHESYRTSARNASSGQYPHCSSRASTAASPTGASNAYSPAAGVQRFITALRHCSGMASADQLRKAYRELYKVDWNEHELKKYFGMTSSRKVIETYLEDLVEITSIRGAGLRCYKLIEREPEPTLRSPPPMSKPPPSRILPPARNPPSVMNPPPVRNLLSGAELHKRLISIMVDKEPEPVHLDSMSNLYREKYGVELDPENQYHMSWKELVLEKFAGYIVLDLRGYLRLNMDEPELKDLVMQKHVKASLEADIDSDSYKSCTSSPSQSTSELRDLPTVTFRLPNQEPVEDRTVYVDTSYQVKREVQKIKQEPIERMFERNMRLTRSFHGRSTVTAYFGDEDLSDVAGADLPINLKESGLRITIPGSRPQNAPSAQQQRASCSVSVEQQRPSSVKLNTKETTINGEIVPERPSSSMSNVSRSSSTRERLEKTFASIGSFFRRGGTIAEDDELCPSTSNSCQRNNTGHVKNDIPNGYISRTGKENVVPEKDVECAHPYFNVHVKSASGDARSLAVQRGLIVK
ncbi:hypothetical protein Y032_0098g3064 [Ancylostoma ceylanicum]|uniref:Uncharacterized protein n=1 Tax=Ancylostoma ceylanicum TaxID=53326 RepID=A0A016TIX3_9BILA|nr:hypothetical protein Y032_0098g3064 [Ancylostoma ceylanicum]